MNNSEIKIWGVSNHKLKYITIPYKIQRNTWTTIFVQYSNINHNRGTYVINDISEMHGVFFTNSPPMFEQWNVFLEGRLGTDGKKIQNAFRGCISSVEIYTVSQAIEDGIPIVLRDLIIKYQRIKK